MRVQSLLDAARRKRTIRIAFGVGIAVLLLSAGAGVVEEQREVSPSEIREQAQRPPGERTRIADARAGVTVVTTSPRKGTPGSIVAFGPGGKVLYYNRTYGKYFDVDPAPTGSTSVEYVAGTELGRKDCPAAGVEPCSLIVIERVNLTTGRVTRLHRKYVPGGSIWHDVDRLGDDRFLVADIASDSVYVLNTTSGLITWRWEALNEYSIRDGGQVSDWTHLNDVELTDSGRVMVSLRNFDTVAFIDRERGVVAPLSLGNDDDHATLYEQHNPDYIPRERGGPAVVVADSENNRVLEYQRDGGTWRRTWTWSDPAMQWPRDADRLPNGHTLITDSNGNRVIEVDRAGEVVWSVGVDTPYEAERLGTGDESAGGHSAASLGLGSRGATGVATDPDPSDGGGPSFSEGLVGWFKGLLPNIVVNGLLFVMPAWVDARVFVSLLSALGVGIFWGLLELRWSAWSVSISVERE